MNCVEWEERVALHAGGDLAAGEAAAVEEHLGECPGCQVLWSGLREDLAALRAAHADLPDAAHFTAVRSRVMAELESQARPWWKRSWVYGFAAVVAALLVFLAIPSRGPVPVPPRILATIPPAPLFFNHPPAPAPEPALPPRHHRDVALVASAQREPVTVKLQTSNPNIVIYWIAN